jgi:hypothetical protein
VPPAHTRVLAASNAKVTEGIQHAGRDAQFAYINDEAAAFIVDGEPAIRVDAKKKLIGDFHNGGAKLEPKWSPRGSGCTTSATPRR